MGSKAPEGIFLAADLAEIEPVGGDVVKRAEFARGHESLEVLNERMILQQVANHEDTVVGAGQFDQFVGFREIKAERFLDEHVLACEQGSLSEPVV